MRCFLPAVPLFELGELTQVADEGQRDGALSFPANEVFGFRTEKITYKI